jgi:hypothetical protein
VRWDRRGLWAALFLFLLIGLPQHAVAGRCPFGISPETAQRLFERMKQVPVGEGYRFEGVSTNKTEMSVLWSLNGKACPPIQVIIEGCTPLLGLPALQLAVPPELSISCPGLEAVVQGLSGALSAEHLVGQGLPLPDSALLPFIVVVGLVAVSGLLVRRRLTPTARTVGWGGIGWITLTLAAATPYFFNVPVAVTVELGAMWMVFAALLFEGCAQRHFQHDRSRWSLRAAKSDRLGAAASRARRLSLVGLFIFSLLLHWSLSSGGPGDLRLNLGAIWSPELELRWGPAPISLFRLLGFVLGNIRDTEIIWCNLILSSLIPILLYGIVAELEVSKPAALLAAFVVAAHPLLIAFSGVLERQPTYLFAACGSTLALIGFLQRGRWNLFIAFVLGAVLATTSRPEGAQVLVVHWAVLLVSLMGDSLPESPPPNLPRSRNCSRGRELLDRLRHAVGPSPAANSSHGGGLGRGPQYRVVTFTLLLLTGLAFAYIRTAVESTFPSTGKPLVSAVPLLWSVLFQSDFTPFAWIVAWMVGLALGRRRRAAWVALVTLLGLDIVWRWTGVYYMFVGHERQVASARYESILLVPFAIGIALLIQAVREARPWWKVTVAAVFVAFTAMTWQRSYETLLKPFTVDYEYHFLKRHALTLPSDARLYVLDAPLDDTGFLDAHLVGQFAGSAVTFALWSERNCDDLLRDPSPAYLYIGSSCAELVAAPNRQLPSKFARWMQDCTAMRARVRGDAVEEIDVPARKMSWHDFKDRTVRLGLYRLRDPSVCLIDREGSGKS